MGDGDRSEGKERVAQKVYEGMRVKGLSADEAFDEVTDVIRYTFQFPDDQYAAGTLADCERLAKQGFEPFDRRNSWGSEQYKGISSRWREPRSGQVFEVEFHTKASYEAKQATHAAYKRLCAPEATDRERGELQDYQRRVASSVPVPPGAAEISSFRIGGQHG